MKSTDTQSAIETGAVSAQLDSELQRIILARHHDPFAVLGRHRTPSGDVVRAIIPQAETVRIGESGPEMQRIPGTDLFECRLEQDSIPQHYRLVWTDKTGQLQSHIDPYTFPPQLADFDLYLFGEGRHWHIYRFLGAHPRTVDGIDGILFATWAPNAERISVVGDFNAWDGRRHPMRVRGSSGVWELFIPELKPGTLYKFEIRNRQQGTVFLKTDPYGRQFELRPNTASIVPSDQAYDWHDDDWMEHRANRDWLHEPMSVYEVHLGSWRRDASGHFLNYRELAEQLVAYVKKQGFSHIELLPITEHPFDGSWGYQTTGYFAPTSRFGTPDDFRYFVDYCHQNGIGVFLDWVPAHFPKDAHGLAHFDGTALYEHEDPRLGEHRDWGTLIYNYGRNEVRNFLLGSALYWLEEFHIDGLRVDAVASMLYLDYSRQPGDWIPNKYGGNENLEAIAFLRELNTVTHQQFPGTLIMAEESTAWPQVTRPTWTGGLGFSMKWNMGWMHDTLAYMSKDPIYRHYHHDQLTFGLLYAFTENFILPFSHDEVVHGKGSMLQKMPGDEWQRFANLRLLYTFMFTYPGKKLLFMGCEFGQSTEWNYDKALEWHLLEYPFHNGLQRLVGDLNQLYRETPALHRYDFEQKGFEWIDCHDAPQSVLSYLRRSSDEFAVMVFNFTPVPRQNYRIGVPEPGVYTEVLNSDSRHYGGSNVGNSAVTAEAKEWMGRPYSISLTLPPLAGIVLTREVLKEEEPESPE
ncbi:1,4-alpha-glucan branching enzyme [Methylocaldum szegediense]|uniref:1,4-alpha-glucan branching enzyme GlgB n=1 Tax=Methylocaldum szegediense TaxID=73780 RepID=A0ABM9HWN5_9GAMM|nr:1,4-alpha-glucan branching protein GlgB [Methylocaldum szegediense]CAI8726576.1 1,4-alpha-glucan branching enzyme [Methylocaldum szegediense]